MRIKVTQEHIDSGKPRLPGYCPIALAGRSAGLRLISVGRTTITACFGNKARYLQLPKSAVQFIRRFDSGKPVEPIEFEIPSEVTP